MTGLKPRRFKRTALLIAISLAGGCAQQPAVDSNVTPPAPLRQETTGKFHPALPTEKNSHVTSLETGVSDEPTVDDLWWTISDNLAFATAVPDDQVAKQLSWLDSNQRYFDNTVARAELYLPYVLDKVLENDLPAEVALLPFIESAYNPFANSPSGAAGLWQFIPSTADGFGLENNRWYEARRDITASTDAAITYLSELNAMFDGDWLLTFAAYNCGPGTVRRAIEKNQKLGQDTDFWSLKLPKITQRYVPRLIALSKVIAESDAYQVELKPLSTAIPFSPVEVNRPVDLNKIAELTSMTSDELVSLNPGYTKWVTPPDGTHVLLLPNDSVDLFQKKLVDDTFNEWRPLKEYVVQKGDTLGKIAQRHGLSMEQLTATNNIEKKDSLKIGQVLRLPFHGDSLADTKAKSRPQYKVKTGDSLWSIARQFDIELADIKNWNQLASAELLRPGQTLYVGPETNFNSLQYEVRQGDSLYTIAKQFNVALADLMSWNNLQRKHTLQPGQRLKLYN